MALTDNILAYWKFDEGTGTNAADATGNGADFTLHSASWAIPGKINDGLSTTSSTYGVSTTGFAIGTNGASWAGWVLTTFSSTNAFIFSGGNAVISQFAPIIYAGGYFGLQISNSGTYPHTTAAVNDGAYHHLCATIPFSTQYDLSTVLLYVDGSLAAATSGVGTLSSFGSGAYHVNANVNNGFGFTAKMDEFGIWGRVLSSTEISTLYNSGAGLQYPFIGGAKPLFRTPLLNGLGGGGPFFSNPLGRSMIGWRPSPIIPRKAFA